MDIPLREQCFQFVCAIGLGIALAVVYLISRTLGRRSRPVLWDIVFTAVSLTAGTVFFLTVCSGFPRVYHLSGIAFGAAILYVPCRRAGRSRSSQRRKHEKEKIPSDP